MIPTSMAVKRMCASMTNPSALLERKNAPRWWKCRPIIARVEMKHMIERAMPHALLELEKLSSLSSLSTVPTLINTMNENNDLIDHSFSLVLSIV